MPTFRTLPKAPEHIRQFQKRPTRAQLRNAQVQMMFVEKLKQWINDPILFIKDMWGLTPQPLLPEYEQAARILIEQQQWKEFRQDFFGPFQRGINLTWQQWLIALAVEAAATGKASKRISVASAHGIGKSCISSMVILWYLFCHQNAQIAVTAPNTKQMFDVLWKELSIWIKRLHPAFQGYFEWQSEYIRHKEAPQEWFASARTARKESPEALAGVHGQHVMALADEASGVPDAIYDTMEGSLTEEDILVLLISNPTRLTGYFYDTHNKPSISKKWQTLQFDNISSPIVRQDYNQDIIDKHGKDSDEYRIRVLGQFPKADSIDDKGYTALLQREEIKEEDIPYLIDNHTWIGTPIMGIDPAGEGKDKTAWVIRDQFKAALVHEEAISDPISIARITRLLAERNKVLPDNIFIDSFGIGAYAAVEIAKGGFEINPVNVGDVPEDQQDRDTYLNKRACNYHRIKRAIKSGFKLYRNKQWIPELTSIKERRTEKGKVQIQPKRDARKEGIPSPNASDALSLTFEVEEGASSVKTLTRSLRPSAQEANQQQHLQSSNQVNTIRRTSTTNINSAI